ncbi:Syntaxin-binding protein 1, variant 2, partial [Bonamia ostreae]
MIEPCCGDKKDYVALITDQSTLQMISSVCSVHDINLAGVGVVLNLKFKRDQMPVSAIYFVNPTPKNVRKICNDFTKKRSMYRKVHLFFNGHVSGESMEMIRRNTRLVEKLSTLKEVNIHFFVEEDRVFSLRRASLQTMYPISKKRTAKELKDIAKGLASLCLTMNEFPYVRYMKSSECCENIARYFNDKIDSKIRKLSDWEYREKRAILLILDRNYDKVSPLMHEYTYKAMVADLLTLDKNFV